MWIDLSGKTAVVTGSSSGIGLAIAAGLAGSGPLLDQEPETDILINNLGVYAAQPALEIIASDSAVVIRPR